MPTFVFKEDQRGVAAAVLIKTLVRFITAFAPGRVGCAWLSGFRRQGISSTPGLLVLNKLVKTFGKKSNLKFGLIQTRQLH